MAQKKHKHPLTSKTIWANVLLALLIRLWPKGYNFVSENPETFVVLQAVMNIGLRLITKQALKWSVKLISTASFLMLTACSSQMQILEPGVFYKRDLELEVNGQRHSGVGIVKDSLVYEIIIRPKTEISLLLIRSCHREDAFEKISSGWLSKKEFRYRYEPRAGLEDSRTCPLRIDAYESAKGQHAWAYLDFEHPAYEIPFEVTCNGETKQYVGAGVCQSKAGLVQRLYTISPIRFAPAKPDFCAEPKKTNLGYEFEVTNGECLYHFDTRDGQLGRMVFIGYQGVLVREAQ